MLRINVEMRCAGAAFGTTRADALREAARILAGLARELEEQADGGPGINGEAGLYDQNGNHVGDFRAAE